ncbi:MAG: endonuclease III [Bacteroidales bacterium]|jgi:endonuclease-3|nr:endonuclease III [Bacteroidales bacterium]MEE1226883.1 endonuclease III [Bacteroidales bacterium]
MRKQERYALTIEKLKELFPNADTELHYETPFQLLVAVILSAQCTDKRVNIVTPALFERYASVKSMAESSQEEIYSYIKSISYPNSKSRNLKKMAERLHEVYHDEIPDDPQELQTLAGVGRKTAMVILAVLYKRAVMPVDTHVHRVSARIGLTLGAKNVLETERQLLSNLTNAEDMSLIHHQLILLGRYICKARKPMCEQCTLKECCKYFKSKNK